MHHPTAILIRGLPGSGKSYLAASLQEALGADHCIINDPDAIDTSSKEYTELSNSLANEGVEAKFHSHRFLKARAFEAIGAGKTVIWNQAFTDYGGFNRTAIALQTYALEHGVTLPLLVVEVNIDERTARERTAHRATQGGHAVPDDAWDRFMRDYTSFADKGFETVIVHGGGNIQESVAAVLAALKALK